MISGVTIALFLAVVHRNKSKSELNKCFFLMLISLLIMFIIGPNTLLNIDRSRSFYVLSWVNSHSIKIGSNDELIINVKSPEKSNSIAIRERLQEQTERGLIHSNGNKYELTWKGKMAYQIAEVLAKFFALQGWMNNRI